jgi:hypothetical protein
VCRVWVWVSVGVGGGFESRWGVGWDSVGSSRGSAGEFLRLLSRPASQAGSCFVLCGLVFSAWYYAFNSYTTGSQTTGAHCAPAGLPPQRALAVARCCYSSASISSTAISCAPIAPRAQSCTTTSALPLALPTPYGLPLALPRVRGVDSGGGRDEHVLYVPPTGQSPMRSAPPNVRVSRLCGTVVWRKEDFPTSSDRP